jgi:solute carrier family 39 (zinc transporter), member 1/2/3
VISLGGSLSRSGFSFNMIALLLFIFAITAPIGVIIGMHLEDSSPIILAIFMGISAGSFIYVASSEVIVNEFGRGKHQFWKFVFVVLGATLITLIWLNE